MAGTEIYLDTSIIGGYFDEEFKKETREFWRLRDKGYYRFVSSAVVLREVMPAPQHVVELFQKNFERSNILVGNDESDELADYYMEQKIVPEKYFDDAQHVAICTVARIRYLASWNFIHLVNVNRENAFNAANLLRGYGEVRIVSPKSLIYGHEEGV
jgi:predicted nucleic acid-binding protein